MSSSNQAEIQASFTRQAEDFESRRMSFSKADYLAYMVSKIAPTKEATILEVAAGTGVCGRALAPHVRRVTCLDMTPAMLAVGKAQSEQAGLNHMSFVLGDAAALPFPDAGFDIVLSRLAFHHFPAVEPPFAEMVRVLRPGGRLVLIDMEASAEPLRESRDRIEQLRDPSHVRNCSRAELLALYAAHGLTADCCETTRIPVDAESWLELTHTPPPVREEIRRRFTDELNGGEKTGFAPYTVSGQLRFDQQWLLLIGRKG